MQKPQRFAKTLSLFLALALALTLLTGCGDSGPTTLTADQASETLDALLTKVSVSNVEPRLDISGSDLDNTADELPDISNYPLSVTGSGVVDVEIVASTEKAGSGMDSWLNLVAENFNKAQPTLRVGRRVA